jgi:hypothetical protein
MDNIMIEVLFRDIRDLLRMFEDVSSLLEQSIKSIDCCLDSLIDVDKYFKEKKQTDEIRVLVSKLSCLEYCLEKNDYHALKAKHKLCTVYPYVQELYKVSEKIYESSRKA